jgi:hypothetical protein
MDPTAANRPRDLTPELQRNEIDDTASLQSSQPTDFGPHQHGGVKPARAIGAWLFPVIILLGLLIAAAFAWHRYSDNGARTRDVGDKAAPNARPIDERR